MIDWLVTLLLPVSSLLLLLLLAHHQILSRLGAKTAYYLWSLVPLGMLFYSVPIKWQDSTTVNDIGFERYWVVPTQKLQQAVASDWLSIIWAIVAVLILLYWLGSQYYLNRYLLRHKVSPSELVTELPQGITVYLSSHAHSPMLVGFFQQKLILPEDFNDLYTPEQRELILEHEICHFQRKDMYWNMLALFCLMIFWFHPLVWLAYARYRRDQELSCDQIVLARKSFDSKVTYGKALLVAAETSPPFQFATISFKKYGDKDIMVERLNNIKNNRKASKTGLSILSLFTISMLSSLSYAGNHFDDSSAIKHANMMQGKTGIPYPVYRIEPKYPEQAIADQIEGSVLLSFDIDDMGKVQNVEVVNAKPSKIFNRSAKVALSQWQYSAPSSMTKNNLVQLDFALNENTKLTDLVERIKVGH
ncbi:TonB family protein [Colwelliaceae bacterium 6471]